MANPAQDIIPVTSSPAVTQALAGSVDVWSAGSCVHTHDSRLHVAPERCRLSVLPRQLPVLPTRCPRPAGRSIFVATEHTKNCLRIKGSYLLATSVPSKSNWAAMKTLMCTQRGSLGGENKLFAGKTEQGQQRCVTLSAQTG